MKYTSHTTGYSLVEVLVSIAVLLLAVVGPMSIATQSLKSAGYALEQNTALFLAQEGIEGVFAIRGNYGISDIDDDLTTLTDTSWDWIGNELNGVGDPCNGDQLNSVGDTCDIGIDFDVNPPIGSAVLPINLYDCNGANASNCQLYEDATNARAVIMHDASGTTETPYTRIVTVEYESPESVSITATVSWNSSVFSGTTQTVSLTSYMFDSNYEI